MLGYNQEQYSQKINISRSALSKIEIGDRSPSIDLLIEIAELSGVTLDYLILGRTPQEEMCIRDSIEAGAFYDCEKLKDVTGLQKSDPVEYADEFWRIQGKRLTMPCGTDQPQIRHWDESEFQSIARRCAEADASAMYQMKEYFHHKSLQYPDVTFYARAAN